MAKSATIQSVQTPRGELCWVTITGEGKESLQGKMQYMASIAFDPKDQAWIDLEAEVKKFWVENKPKGIKMKSNGFYMETEKTDETDEEGDPIRKETGRRILQLKTNATWPDGKPTKVKIYNSKGKPVSLGDVQIGNGSVGYLGGSYDIYAVKDKHGNVTNAGVTFYLNSIKISKLEEYSAGEEDWAEDEEDGFTGEQDWEGEEEATSASAGPRL